VCTATEGIVAARDAENGKHGGALVLTHHTPSGKEFHTVYQHVDITTTPPELKAGAVVRRGQYLGRTSDVSIIHLHFGVAVQGPSAMIHGVTVPSLWYFIDPWGVYDYYEHDNRSNGNYLPPESQPDIFQARITGSVHTVQWRTQPLFETIPVARNTESYKAIVRIQSRARSSENLGGTLPDEHEQFLVWLKDDPNSFLVPTSESTYHTSELGLVTLLREAFIHEKPVRLEYRYDEELRYIMAVSVGG